MIHSKLSLLVCFYLLITSCLSAQSLTMYFEKTDQFFSQYVTNDYVDYIAIKNNPQELEAILKEIEQANLATQDANTQKAFWINTYNILAIKGIINRYPIGSPQYIAGFFDKLKHKVGGKKLTLNEIEQEYIFKKFEDERLHFALVCVAKGCPPILNKAYLPATLEQQLHQQTTNSIQDTSFIKIIHKDRRVVVSQLFNWYYDDFDKKIIAYLNRYLPTPIPLDYKLDFYDYDWSLNDTNPKNNTSQPWRSSALYPKGMLEVKIFNNIYTQQSLDGFSDFNSRSTYFSSFTQILYGVNHKLNAGFDIVYKSNVTNDLTSNSPFDALRFRKGIEQQQITHFSDTLNTYYNRGTAWFAPKIKIQPFSKIFSLSMQQTIYIPVNQNIETNYVWFSQFFYDKVLSRKTSMFVEAHLWATIRKDFKSAYFSPNLKAFISYFPTNRWTIYGMLGSTEVGGGMKYLLTPHFELEILLTEFLPYAFNDGRQASTFNLGFRYFY